MEKSELVIKYVSKYTSETPSIEDIANAYRDAVVYDGHFELTIEDFLNEFNLNYDKEFVLKKAYENVKIGDFEWKI